MTRSLGFLFTTCTCALLLSVSTARASDGRITFSGAVVEPTCSIDASLVNSTAATLQAAPCSGTSTAADAGRIASRTAVALDVAVADHDRMLTYFAGYLNNAGIADATVVVQTYE